MTTATTDKPTVGPMDANITTNKAVYTEGSVVCCWAGPVRIPHTQHQVLVLVAFWPMVGNQINQKDHRMFVFIETLRERSSLD